MQHETLHCPTGHFSLSRPGCPPKMPLRAWDAADEYLIDLICNEAEYSDKPLTILNDQYGALALALNHVTQYWINDSFCANQALIINQQLNNLDIAQTTLNSLSFPENGTELAAMGIPKNVGYLEYQLSQLAKNGTKTVLLAGMMKHLPKNILRFLQTFGNVQRYPFKKKATVFKLELIHQKPLKYPKNRTHYDISLNAHANVFGRDKLDQGAALLIENLSTFSNSLKVADLCCGTGIIGLKYKQENPLSDISYFDESHMAVESAKVASALNHQETTDDRFIWDDGLKSAADKSFDLILCNPPFHEQHAVGDHIAWRLFNDAKRCLTTKGQLVIVGNRHLGYHTKLKRLFAQVNLVAQDSKFVVISAQVKA